MSHDVAASIVGTACVLPGAHSVEELWSNVLAQRAAFRTIPKERLNLDDYSADAVEPSGTIDVRVAALIVDYHFPRERFRIPKATYDQVDPAHWLALDVAAEAIRVAERRIGRLDRHRTGVIVANTLTGEVSRAHALRHRWPYVRRALLEVPELRGLPETTLTAVEHAFKRRLVAAGDESLAGGLANTIAGRIANYFGFGGGCYTVDGACASSLVAIVNAFNALQQNDLDAVVVGAVDVSIDPFELVGFSRLGALAVDEMRVFSRSPSGFLPGEGAAFVVLVRDDPRAIANIRACALSSDGTGGITRPSVDGQLRVLRAAYDRAELDPLSVTYFEAHGTGTGVGDQVELAALQEIRSGAREADVAFVGSAKALVGHTKAAAGMVGLLKTIMALRREIIPPQAIRRGAHTALGTHLRIAAQPEVWPADRPLLGGVSAFGFGGINAHVILERQPRRPRRQRLSRREARQGASAQDCELLLVSAPDEEQLIVCLESLALKLGAVSCAELGDIAIELTREATPHDCRLAIIADSPWRVKKVIGEVLEAIRHGGPFPRNVYYATRRRTPAIALIFPGQGGALRFNAGAIGRRFPELDRHFVSLEHNSPESTAVAQPAIVAASLAGLEFLRSLGVAGDVGVGHSLGELAALSWAGAFDADTLCALVSERGRIMESTCDRGEMAAIAGSSERVQALMSGGTVVACRNGRGRCVVAGQSPGMNETLSTLRSKGFAFQRLPVSTPFHSPFMMPAQAPFSRSLDARTIGAPSRPISSTIFGRMWRSSDDVRDALVRQIIEPVRFEEALAALPPIDVAIEVGAGHATRDLIADQIGAPVISLDIGGESLRGPLSVAGFLFAYAGTADAAKALTKGRFTKPAPTSANRNLFRNPCGVEGDTLVAQAETTRAISQPAFEPIEPPTRDEASLGPTDMLRLLIARRTELPQDSVAPEARVLDDLHLSSLAVAQLIGDLARALGVEMPRDPLAFASATVSQIADAFQHASKRISKRQEAIGIAPWIRRLEIDELPLDSRRVFLNSFDWTYTSDEDDRLDALLRSRLTAHAGAPRAHAIYIGPAEPSDLVARLLAFAQTLLRDEATTRVICILRDTAGASFVRSLAIECGDIPLALATVEGAATEGAIEDFLADAVASEQYLENCIRSERRYGRALKVVRDRVTGQQLCDSLSDSDVLLVSGGGKGIAAECAFQRALATGAALILIGRSRVDDDADLRENLARFERAGVRFRYVRADVRFHSELSAAIAEATAQVGPVTAILHGAGSNEPLGIRDLTVAASMEAIDVKLAGAENLLALCGAPRLREFISFGSIIAQTGMHGEAHYALANESLARWSSVMKTHHPTCRFVTIEWSIWSGVGMGERLGRVDELARLGVAPIAPDRGIQTYLEICRDDALTGSIVVAGRVGGSGTIEVRTPDLPLGRFLERRLVYFPNVELIVECDLSLASDPYLKDHRIDGVVVIPGVIILEAIMQVAGALTGWPATTIEDIRFERPLALGGAETCTMRIAALWDQTGVRLEVRSSETSFSFIHASARVLENAAVLPRRGIRPTTFTASGATVDGSILYESLLFHRGRFAGVREYTTLTPLHCEAHIGKVSADRWFAPRFPQQLTGGDPAVRDMAIHAVQACVPTSLVLPVSIDAIVRLGTIDNAAAVSAVETERGPGFYVFDIAVYDSNGLLVEELLGVRFQRLAANEGNVPLCLIDTAVNRLLLDSGINGLAVACKERVGDSLEKRPDGRPTGNLSRTYAAGLELRCVSDRLCGIDAMFADATTLAGWRTVTNQHVELPAAMGISEPEETSRARIWCAMESSKKAQSGAPPPISCRSAHSSESLVIFASGDFDVATVAIKTPLSAAPLVIGVAFVQAARREEVATP